MLVPSTSDLFPPNISRDAGGWMYVNLDNGGSASYSLQRNGLRRASQNWLIASFFAEPMYAVELPAIALGNGCSAPAPQSSTPNGFIGPAPNPTP